MYLQGRKMGGVALQSMIMKYVMWQLVQSCAVLDQKLSITRLYKPITVHRLHFWFWTMTQPLWHNTLFSDKKMTLSLVTPPFVLTHQNHVHNWPRPRFRPHPVFHSSNYPWARAHWWVGLFVPCQHWWGRWQCFDWSTQTHRTHIYPFLFSLEGLDQQQRCGANVEATDTRTRQCRRRDRLLDGTNQEHQLLAFCEDHFFFFHIPRNKTITPPQLTALVIFILISEWGRKTDQSLRHKIPEILFQLGWGVPW